MLKRILTFMLAGALLACPLSAVPAGASETAGSRPSMDGGDAETVSRLSGEYSHLQEELDKLRKEKEQIERDQKNTSALIKNVRKSIRASEKQLSILDDKISDQEDRLGALSEEHARTQAKIDESLAAFKQRLRAIYMSGRAGKLEMLLSANGFLSLLTRAEVLRRMSEYDDALIASLLSDRAEVESLSEQTRNALDDLNVTLKKEKKKRGELDSRYEECERLLAELEKDSSAYAEYIAEKQKETEEVQREIDEILSKYVSEQDYVGGELAWPLPGFTKITSPYGKRRSGWHTGTDIAGRNADNENCYGYPILAANSGTVIAVGNRGDKSYGRYLILDHGGGCKTLYAHCSKILVKEGETVLRGAVIAKAGSSGNSTGPHLHFELWIDNKRVDPMKHLRKPKK